MYGKRFLAEEQTPLDQEHTRQRFTGKVAVVTGGASGIGRGVVDRFTNDGASVAIVDIDSDLGKKVSEELSGKGFSVQYYNVDVSNKGSCVQAAQDFAKLNGGRIHFLVNSAVYFGSQGLNAERSDWDMSFKVNVEGYANMVQACFPHMMAAGGRECAIVNVASISAHRAQPTRWTYSATKGAVATMTKCMALDLSTQGIRVNSVSPAWIWTPEVAKAAEFNRIKYEPTWGPFHMLRRMGETSEVAAAISFLCSKDASFITGTDLPVDGGYMSMGPEGLGEKSCFAGTKK
ncbi:cyclohexanol dehydrogenase-like [Corticium candelabrum]|uniref:cyclohexanol dehydrogenase-like n=1 Tax=Corticium candelabrum TaxID=121492 RepID=UPI002E26A34F|nr:cyclohexanol dehydrogenase-like [Corticium candelabrum]